MPTRVLPPNPNLDHLKHQAKDLLKAHAARDRAVAQRIREFHPGFREAIDDEIFEAPLSLSDAQLAIAREYGFPSWTRLKRRIERPSAIDDVSRPHHERIEDPIFRCAVDLADAGDVAALQAHLAQHPHLVNQQATFEGGNYFRNPTLLEFTAENPVRHRKLPKNIVGVMKVILDAGANISSREETLGLVCSGCVPRECGVQAAQIDLLCEYGANPDSAMQTALAHGEFEAAHALLRRGAHITLPVAAALGRVEDARRLLAASDGHQRHKALALASQFGHLEIVRLLLDAGEDPNRYSPIGLHSHSTPLHQAAAGGHAEVVRLLVQRGATPNLRDTLFGGTPADWAKHEGKKEVERYLRVQMMHGTVNGRTSHPA
jgi:ankyrin repeat protein